MAEPRIDVDDQDQPLSSIQSAGGQSLVRQLLEIQTATIEQSKSLHFIQNLDCLYLDKTRDRKRPPQTRDSASEDDRPVWLRKSGLNAIKDLDYVAVSWTWGASEPYEDSTAGHHLVQLSNGKREPSGVRNRVFDRIRRYLKAQPGLQYVWIDMHCICQEPGPEKTRGMQAMDMVYKLSNHPIALLARPIESHEELCLLADVLQGNFVSKHASGEFRLSSFAESALERLRRALSLLDAITSDLWWTRAWTFQENYRCDGQMTLLIPHPEDGEIFREKTKNEKIFGNVVGDISISSRKFQTESTKLCKACIIAERNDGIPGLSGVAERILKTAPNYEFLLREAIPGGQLSTRWSQSPRIIKDIESRGSKFCHDRLAIVANCCQYSIRLDDAILRQGSHSMSLSMLALYLLNGEIMENACGGKGSRLLARCRGQTVADFIAEQSFANFCPPVLRRPLFYNNGCRFINVQLTEEGLKTSGHIWKLYRTLPTEQFALPASENRIHHSHWRRRTHIARRLAELRDAFHELEYDTLVQKLEEFLEANMRPKKKDFFSGKYMWTMAKMVVAAMDAQKPLVLGGLLDHQQFNYTGIFVLEDLEEEGYDEDKDEDEDEDDCFQDEDAYVGFFTDSDNDDASDSGESGTQEDDDDEVEIGSLSKPVYIFTSSKPMKESSENLYPNDIDKHVSIEVHGDNLESIGFQDEPGPKLLIERWVNGLCFFQNHSRRSVVFPWHPALRRGSHR
ncbi:hypothetical protein HER10_EVM0012303 [Colletotrichum scovillei]|uniref:Heterokaryon incompatibility domain-containing protein n=1 Tax=Colletotrichum scovillei TaxID=1209932 RepID=A0A9P7U8T9_9PEZI|nr:uncharacterized protein HER10_EVM0012303 [Colletotrichum scovillei]KAF4775591.1 hypothetical protein HER10_EVM0012303 [Colletotrichum scovillei]KAG7039624.1 hypothetical protein JMJ78_0001372 [Colletotrichum scovillei]KAG7041799.1 hypothetical protein JMJ77_0012317 [Colletotrichum scovillei]KAG7061830.1 hypothetical protein JMJ76_0003786 [Colletotrichum scovillei]